MPTRPPVSSDIERTLIEIVGPDGYSRKPEDLICHAYDATCLKYMPHGIVWPENSHQISRIMHLAGQHSIPITPRGAGTGLSGGALPVQGGLVLSLVRMNRILHIDPDNLLAEVEPGVVNADLDQAVSAYGLFYPPDPASFEFSTLGGNVAESAGGPRAVKYGVTRDYVLGLEVVLANGDIIVTGSKTTKCVVGYDLTRLFVGSEGTLGIFTKIFLRLIPRPEALLTILVLFRDITAAARTVSALISHKIVPTTLEFMDQATIDCVREYGALDLPTAAGSLLLIELDGAPESLRRQKEAVYRICRDQDALQISDAEAEEERARLWKARRAVSPALHRLGDYKINEDIVVPRSQVPFILMKIADIGAASNLKIVNFGHAGDGNIHVNIMLDEKTPALERTVSAAVRDIFKQTIACGGTISGEHGIGLTKAPYLSLELNPATLKTMKTLKQALDPQNILNPGKMF